MKNIKYTKYAQGSNQYQAKKKGWPYPIYYNLLIIPLLIGLGIGIRHLSGQPTHSKIMDEIKYIFEVTPTPANKPDTYKVTFNK